MARVIPRDDWELAHEIERLGNEGLNQSQIVERLGIPLSTLRNRVERHGLDLNNAVQVRAKIGGWTLSELIDSGAIVCADPEPAEAEGVAA